MKPKTAMGVCFLTGLLLFVAGLRDIFAPGLFSISSRVMSKIDLTMLFAAGAIFWFAAVAFYRKPGTSRT